MLSVVNVYKLHFQMYPDRKDEIIFEGELYASCIFTVLLGVFYLSTISIYYALLIACNISLPVFLQKKKKKKVCLPEKNAWKKAILMLHPCKNKISV